MKCTIISLVFYSLLVFACKLQKPQGQSKLSSDDALGISEISSFYSLVFQFPYTTRFSQLTDRMSGEVNEHRIPYADYWYPEKTEKFFPEKPGIFGTDIDGALTLYDQAFYSGESTAAKWEIDFHNGGFLPSNWRWYGHCNGWATAASRHQNPQISVVRPKDCLTLETECVTFTPMHIRALLAEVYMNARARFIAGKRCLTLKENLNLTPENRNPPDKMGACEDVNPGSFHLALINWIGIQKQVLIFDFNRDQEVWNYPIYKYAMQIANDGKALTETQAVELIGRNDSTTYVFNPKAVEYYQISTTVTYTMAFNQTVKNDVPSLNPKQATYEYILEVGEGGDIVGGEWLNESRIQHPDFIWMPFEPKDPPGNRRLGNAHVKPEVVLDMWAESVGFDPKDPFNDENNPNNIVFMPKPRQNWGVVESQYQVKLDGSYSGSVFLGKPTVLEIELSDSFPNSKEVSIALNGKSLTKLQLKDQKSARFDFDPQIGMNELAFTWPQLDGSVSSLDMTINFFAIP